MLLMSRSFAGSPGVGFRATRFWKAGGTVSVRLPGLTVVGIRDQRTLTNASGH